MRSRLFFVRSRPDLSVSRLKALRLSMAERNFAPSNIVWLKNKAYEKIFTFCVHCSVCGMY